MLKTELGEQIIEYNELEKYMVDILFYFRDKGTIRSKGIFLQVKNLMLCLIRVTRYPGLLGIESFPLIQNFSVMKVGCF